MTRLLQEVRRFMAKRSGTGVVGVSGGADSVALLRALLACGLPLTVAHVNHQLRGCDSDADEAFVRELCTSLQIPCRIRKIDAVRQAAGNNLEATARHLRYQFFAEVAKEVGATWIATGHTADDQAETVLHRLIRGTGIQGLRGIAVEREAIIRPLLNVTRADVLAHLAEIKQQYREDASNSDPQFTRNRIRHELLPLLKTLNPNVVAALARLAEHACEAHQIITTAAGELLAKAEHPRAANTIILNATALTTSRALIRSLLRLIWERERWPLGDMDFNAWERAVEIACGHTCAGDFPGGISMRHVGRVVQIRRHT